MYELESKVALSPIFEIDKLAGHLLNIYLVQGILVILWANTLLRWFWPDLERMSTSWHVSETAFNRTNACVMIKFKRLLRLHFKASTASKYACLRLCSALGWPRSCVAPPKVSRSVIMSSSLHGNLRGCGAASYRLQLIQAHKYSNEPATSPQQLCKTCTSHKSCRVIASLMAVVLGFLASFNLQLACLMAVV